MVGYLQWLVRKEKWLAKRESQPVERDIEREAMGSASLVIQLDDPLAPVKASFTMPMGARIDDRFTVRVSLEEERHRPRVDTDCRLFIVERWLLARHLLAFPGSPKLTGESVRGMFCDDLFEEDRSTARLFSAVPEMNGTLRAGDGTVEFECPVPEGGVKNFLRYSWLIAVYEPH
jgi:hypothetical protein